MDKIFLASDHAAVDEKKQLVELLKEEYDVVDLGPFDKESVHYPQYGAELAKRVLESNAKGIALCGSGIGISIAVNRFKGIRGALCRDTEDAKMSRNHNDANVICFGARRNSIDEIIEMTKVWLNTEFEGGRHQLRTSMLDQ